ncbi:MAG: TolB family protein, partial [Catenulispora sp.]
NQSAPSAGLDNVFLYNRQSGEVTLVSHAAVSSATGGGGSSGHPVISADGRFVAYVSSATDLVPGQATPLTSTSATTYVYLFDRQTGGNTLVSGTNSGGVRADGDSDSPGISDDGRFVTYESRATNLVPGVTASHARNVYLFDRATGANALVSHAGLNPAAGDAASFSPVISPDGNDVAFTSYAGDLVSGKGFTPGLSNVFLYDRATGKVSLVSGVNGSTSFTTTGYSDSPVINADGTAVAFRSSATHLVAGQGGPRGSNIFLYDRPAGQTTLVSHAAGLPATAAAGNSTSPVIDGPGALVGFLSTATDLAAGQAGGGVNNVFGWVRTSGTNFLASGVNGSPTGASPDPAFLPLLSRDPVILFGVAGTLIPGTGGTANGYSNTLVDITFTAATLLDGSPAGAIAGTLSTFSVLVGQVLLPQFSLPPGGAADNGLFAAGVTRGDGTAGLVTRFVVNAAARSSFTILVQIDAGFGPAQRVFILVATPGSTPPGPGPLPPPPGPAVFPSST